MDQHIMLPPVSWSFYSNAMSSESGISNLCAVHNCTNSKQTRPDLSFFRFPKDEDRCRQWIVKCCRPDLEVKSTKYLYNNCRICSEHFEDSQFMNAILKSKLLRNASPTLFNDPNGPEGQEAKISDPSPPVTNIQQDCENMTERIGYKKLWRTVMVDEVDKKLRHSREVETQNTVPGICIGIGKEDFRYIVRGGSDSVTETSEDLRIVITEEIEDADNFPRAANKMENSGVRDKLRTDSSVSVWGSVRNEPNFVVETIHNGRRSRIFKTGELEFVLVEGDLTPSALRYIVKEMQSNSVRDREVINIITEDSCRGSNNPPYVFNKTQGSGVLKKLRIEDTGPVLYSDPGKHSFMHETECDSKRSRTFETGLFEFILVDGGMTPSPLEMKAESLEEYAANTEVDPLAV
ncbi:uncharacterized protein [Macrobrachium rosenbergii]|uniref:uncharacterized protein n=1 Tax=Macrobrachium rosenbergii TaxID=79674 RepID=UPI0034D6F6FF